MNAISPREKQRRARQRVASAAELNDRLCWRISEWCRLTGTESANGVASNQIRCSQGRVSRKNSDDTAI